MNNKSTVVISRKWRDAGITAFVNQEEVGVCLPLADYIKALATEMGNPATLLTNEQLLKRMQKAAVRVETEAKRHTTRVVS